MVERQAGHVRADAEQRGLIGGERVGAAAGGSTMRVAPMRSNSPRWIASASAARRPSDQAGPISVTPDRQAIAAKTRRHGDGGEIAQIDEIGEGAQPAVRAERIGSHFRKRRAERRGRQQQRIAVAKQKLALRGALRPGMKCVECVHRAPLQAALEDGAGDRVHDFGPPFHDVAQRRAALGDPRPIVEQTGDLQERRDVHRLRAVGDPSHDRGGPASARRRCASGAAREYGSSTS